MKRRQKPDHVPTYIPVGSFIETEQGYFWVQSAKSRYRIITKRLLDSWAPQRVIQVAESNPAVAAMKVSAKLRFRNGSLIWNLSDAKIYLVENGERRWVRNPDHLLTLGVKWGDVDFVSQEEIDLHPLGEDLN